MFGSSPFRWLASLAGLTILLAPAGISPTQAGPPASSVAAAPGLAPTTPVSGAVTDGSGHGWPLYARIDVTGDGTATTFTDPFTGAFSLDLADGNYTFTVSAVVSGYNAEARAVSVPGPAQDFALAVDDNLCDAPGYGLPLPLYFEDFEASDGGYLVGGVLSSWQWGAPTAGPGQAHSGANVWATNLEGDYSNDEHGFITSPFINLSGITETITLRWWQWLQTEGGFDLASVEASNDGGDTFSPVYGEVSGDVDLQWTVHSVVLDPSYAVSNFRVRFRFRSDEANTYPGWYVDDIGVFAGSLVCDPMPGGLVLGNVYSANTGEPLTGATVTPTAAPTQFTTTAATPDDPAVDDSFYMLFSAAGDQDFTASFFGYVDNNHTVSVSADGAVEQDFHLPAGVLAAAPAELSSSQTADQQETQTLTISNTGTADLNWNILEDFPAGASGAQGGRTPAQALNPDILLEEGFESGLVPPAGWTEVTTNAGYNWEATPGNPHTGAFQAHVVADPAPAPQDEWLLSPEMLLIEGTLSFWSAGNTRFCRDMLDNCDLNVWLVVGDVGGDDDVFVGTADEDWGGIFIWSQSLFDLTPLLPGMPFRIGFQYLGQGGEEVGLDDIALDGTTCSGEFPGLSVSPSSGVIAPGGSTQVDITFDTTGLEEGFDTGTLCIFGDDPVNPVVQIPLTQIIYYVDVPPGAFAFDYVIALADSGVTAGCAAALYCPDSGTTRAQMAVFLLKGVHGADYVPPEGVGLFDDVPDGYWAEDWIEQLYSESITAGCSIVPPLYCPETIVSRAQMAVFLLKAEHGAGYLPPEGIGLFDDVPDGYWAEDWIEQLYNEGVTAGCSADPLLYCPESTLTRAQMAVFLVKTFDLPLP